MSDKTDLPTVAVTRLRPGMYVHLDLPWLDHPFWFNAFLLQNEEQVRELQALGIAQVRWDPSKSRVSPLPETPSPPPPKDETQQEGRRQRLAARHALKRRQHEAVIEVRRTVARCAEAYQQALQQTQLVLQQLARAQPQGVQAAKQLAEEAARHFTPQAQVVLQLIAEQSGEEGAATHAINVMVLAMTLAHRLGLDQELIAMIGTAALVHDVGKIRIPTSVLLNPKRNRHEESLYRLHAQYGEEILRQLPNLAEPILHWVRWHHERYDGRGYPEGIKGEEIPIGARTLCLADAVDAMTSERPYRGARPMGEVLEELKRNAGTQFCPKVVEAALKVLEGQRAKG